MLSCFVHKTEGIFLTYFLIFLRICCIYLHILCIYLHLDAYFSLFCAYLCIFIAYSSIQMHINAYSSSAGPLHWPAPGLSGFVPVPPHSSSFIATVYYPNTLI